MAKDINPDIPQVIYDRPTVRLFDWGYLDTWGLHINFTACRRRWRRNREMRKGIVERYFRAMLSDAILYLRDS